MFARFLAFVAVFTFTADCQASIAPKSGHKRVFVLELSHHEGNGKKLEEKDVAHGLAAMSPAERRRFLANPWVLAAIVAAAIAIPLVKGADRAESNDTETESQPESKAPNP